MSFRLPPLLCGFGALIIAGPVAAELPDSAVFRERQMTWEEKAPQTAGKPAAKPDRGSRRYKRTVLVMPRLSSRFGYRFHPIRHAYAMHTGIDIPGPMGTPVLASAGGRVRSAGAAGAYGNMVEIDHGGGLSTRYAHLSRMLVRPGTAVAQGETIALMGSTGRSTGSHLHFEVRTGGRPADPLAYLTQGAAAGARTTTGPVTGDTALDYRAGEPHISQFARARDAGEFALGGGFRAEVASLP